MGNLELQKIMITKFRLSEFQAKELRENIDKFIDEFQKNNIEQSLREYVEKELKMTYDKKDIGERNIIDISRKCICRKKEWTNYQGYYSFVAYVLTIISQIFCLIPFDNSGVIIALACPTVVWGMLKLATENFIEKRAGFISEFNNNFSAFILVSAMLCPMISLIKCEFYLLIIAVIVINALPWILFILKRK